MKIHHKISLCLALVVALFADQAYSGATDIAYPPTTGGGHDFNHAPVGQSFKALAPQVKAGLYIADGVSITNWLSTVYPGQIQPGSYPYAVAPSVKVNVKLLDGEGPSGSVLNSRDITLTAPFMGFIDIDYAALGVNLTVGNLYTILVTDISNQSYPNGVVGWIVPSVTDLYTSAGAYADGHPILQGAMVPNETNIGDNAFHVVDMNPTGTATPPAQTCAGANTRITSIGRNFIVVNSGLNVADHVWYNPQTGISFNGGITTFALGELVTYTGIMDPVAGCYATTVTVMPTPTPIIVSGTLPNGQVGSAYSAALSATGGVAPHGWLATGIPAGISFSNGVFSGTPTTAGSHSVVVTLTDSLGTVSNVTYSISIAAAPTSSPSCTQPSGAGEAAGKGLITAVGNGYIVVGLKKVNYSSCTKVSFGGYTRKFSVGLLAEWEGYSTSGNVTAKVISTE
ncbi:MAG: Ig domain-containing protein [Methylococcaceae bacterium]|nr:Ig domain-containing protein [Methylococcaceae bacterium]